MSKDRSGQRATGLKTLWTGIGIAALLAGCANVGQQQQPQPPQPQPDPAASANPASAPVAGTASTGAPAAVQAAAPAVTVVSTTKVVTKTSWYRVRRGDSLRGIAKKRGCSVKELHAWNHIKGSRLRAGHSLRIVSKQTITVQATAPAVTGAVAGASAGGASAGGAATMNPAVSPADRRAVAAEVSHHARSVDLVWPAQGRVLEWFQPGSTRGIEIGGKPGDPVRAAADGKVMYAGTGLNEYGSLIIVQHNKDFLTAYSHNRRLLVKTGDTVRQGQEIAEMGSENNDRVAVMFEVRHDGKPVDPMTFLKKPQS